ncbi:MAG: flagellar biosynthesis regulator FlaF [Pseudomonadota bacterium]
MSNYAAYQQSQNATQDPRHVEYRLLGQVTAALITAQQVWEKSKADVEAKKQVVDAALWNRNVWSAFRTDLLDEGNQLPKELKAQLISISLFIERETNSIMTGDADFEALIDINQQIIEGLRPKGAEEAAPVDQTAEQTAPTGSMSIDSRA